jgi:hypothetical protein
MSFKTVAMPPQMKPNRPNQPEPVAPGPQPKPRNRKPGQWPLAVRVGVSLLLIWHLAAVFLAPLSIQPSSPLVVTVAQGSFMQYYLDSLYLNHGYHFFAPEPSMGHMIRYLVADDRGSELARGEFPSKKDNWPRLLYHRYFMLAEQCEVAAANEAEANQWKRAYLDAFAQQLMREHEGTQARVQRFVHYPAYPRDVLEGMQLTDPRTYQEEQPIVNARRKEAMTPQVNQGGTYQQNNWRQDVASGWQGGTR